MFNYKKSNTEAIESIDLYFNSEADAILDEYTVFLDAACSKRPEDVSKIKDIVISKNINLIDIGLANLKNGSLATFKPTFVKYIPLQNAIGFEVLVSGRNGLSILNLRLNSAPSGEHIPISSGEGDDGVEGR